MKSRAYSARDQTEQIQDVTGLIQSSGASVKVTWVSGILQEMLPLLFYSRLLAARVKTPSP